MNPQISIIMSVYNGAHKLERTIDSILAQTFQDFEFLIVNDGSTDGTQEILDRYAKVDQRIHAIHQLNQGLTRSLNHACQRATGRYLARQDCGDRSLPTRLQSQLDYMESHPEVVAIGCGVRRVAKQGEVLGESSRDLPPQAITAALLNEGVGLTHPASLFRRDAFMNVGGYREAFRFAQDTDLWLRLVDEGLIGEIPEILFEFEIETNGISASQIERQRRLAEFAHRCRQARLRQESETPYLEQARAISQSSVVVESPGIQKRRAEYFIGSQLLNQRNPSCRGYFISAMRAPSLLMPSVAKWLVSFFKCRQSSSFN